MNARPFITELKILEQMSMSMTPRHLLGSDKSPLLGTHTHLLRCHWSWSATLQSSATKIVDVAFYYFASSSLHVYLLVRETMLWWLALARKKMWRWIASFGESYHDDVLQFAKQLFSGRLLLMTKFFVMRECENILSGYLCVVTTVFSQQDGIYGFKFSKTFLEISSSEISLFSRS